MSLLNSEHPIVINAQLARIVGLNEAIVLQQLNYWINGTASGVEHDGRRWVYNTQDQWQEQFPFWSVDTVKRAFASLKKQRLILVEQLSKKQHDRTNYYAIDHAKLDEMEAKSRVVADQCKLPPSSRAKRPSRKKQPAPIDKGNAPQSTGADCPDVHTETTTETTAERKAGGADAPPCEPKPPMVIEGNGKRIEIPAELRYPGPDTKSHKAWINYAVAYRKRYDTWPVWNATVAGMLTQFINRIGAEAAPKVAAYFLGVNDAFVVKSMHSIKHLLSDAEKYHTQYVTGRSMTATRANQIDQTQSNFDAADEAMKILADRRAQQHAQA